MANLEKYAKDHPSKRGVICWICTIPEVREINAAIRKGLPASVIQEWLIDDPASGGVGYSKAEATYSKIRRHMEGGHADTKKKQAPRR